jgi:hypothetical protein
VAVAAWIHIWVSTLFHWFSHLFLCQYHNVLLPWLCIIVWSRILWYLQHCSFCSILPWLFEVFCVSKWTLGLIFQSLWWMSLEFWWKLCWLHRLFLIRQPSHNIDSANPWAWKIFPSSLVFNFFLQWLVVILVEGRGLSLPLLTPRYSFLRLL